MKDALLPFALLPTMLPTNASDVETWWTIAQRNGVGFVFFVLFLLLAWRSAKREEKLQKERDEREVVAIKERKALQMRNNDLTEQLLTAHQAHAAEMHRLVSNLQHQSK